MDFHESVPTLIPPSARKSVSQRLKITRAIRRDGPSMCVLRTGECVRDTPRAQGLWKITAVTGTM